VGDELVSRLSNGVARERLAKVDGVVTGALGGFSR
jgi:hypothetical protein